MENQRLLACEEENGHLNGSDPGDFRRGQIKLLQDLYIQQTKRVFTSHAVNLQDEAGGHHNPGRLEQPLTQHGAFW